MLKTTPFNTWNLTKFNGLIYCFNLNICHKKTNCYLLVTIFQNPIYSIIESSTKPYTNLPAHSLFIASAELNSVSTPNITVKILNSDT